MELNICKRDSEQPGEHTRRRLADELDEIGAECARLPVRDDRPAEEILGYDEDGVSA